MLIAEGAKMSKSRGNVVNPDELIARHGADVTRLALLFTRPWSADGEWDPAVVAGAERFLARVWRLVVDASDGDDGRELLPATVERVTGDLERMRFNTAIAALMTLVGRLTGGVPAREVKRTLVSLLAPLAPHVTEELWRRAGGDGSVHTAPWPA
jgi:leucyl-tRNA synthetase